MAHLEKGRFDQLHPNKSQLAFILYPRCVVELEYRKLWESNAKDKTWKPDYHQLMEVVQEETETYFLKADVKTTSDEDWAEFTPESVAKIKLDSESEMRKTIEWFDRKNKEQQNVIGKKSTQESEDGDEDDHDFIPQRNANMNANSTSRYGSTFGSNIPIAEEPVDVLGGTDDYFEYYEIFQIAEKKFEEENVCWKDSELSFYSKHKEGFNFVSHQDPIPVDFNSHKSGWESYVFAMFVDWKLAAEDKPSVRVVLVQERIVNAKPHVLRRKWKFRRRDGTVLRLDKHLIRDFEHDLVREILSGPVIPVKAKLVAEHAMDALQKSKLKWKGKVTQIEATVLHAGSVSHKVQEVVKFVTTRLDLEQANSHLHLKSILAIAIDKEKSKRRRFSFSLASYNN